MELKAGQLTPHFSRKEMDCPCCGGCEMKPWFMENLEAFRVKFGRTMLVNSGYRCAKHNASLPNSSPISLHMDGRAADISWYEFNAEQKREMIQLALRYFGGIGIGKTYLHVDVGPVSKLWIY